MSKKMLLILSEFGEIMIDSINELIDKSYKDVEITKVIYPKYMSLEEQLKFPSEQNSNEYDYIVVDTDTNVVFMIAELAKNIYKDSNQNGDMKYVLPILYFTHIDYYLKDII